MNQQATIAETSASPYSDSECNECHKPKQPSETHYVSPEPHGINIHTVGGVTTTYAHGKGVCADCYRKLFVGVYPGEKCPI